MTSLETGGVGERRGIDVAKRGHRVVAGSGQPPHLAGKGLVIGHGLVND
jgi:hypothetical protein